MLSLAWPPSNCDRTGRHFDRPLHTIYSLSFIDILANLRSLAVFSASANRRTTFQVIRQVYKADKLLGFYKGFRLTVIREIPGYFCYFGGYTMTCNLLGVNRETARIREFAFDSFR